MAIDPYNKGLEREVLAASFSLKGSDRSELLRHVPADFLYLPLIRRLYEISAEDGCAPRVAYDKLWTERANLNDSISQEEFMEIMNMPLPSPYPVSDVASRLRDLWARRKIMDLSRMALENAGVVDLNQLVEDMAKVSTRKEGTTYNDRPAEVFGNVLHRAAFGPDESESGGFGIRGVDDALRGLRRNDLVVVGAPPNTGKTPFVLDIMRRRARMGCGHQLVVSLEMDKEDIVRELCAMDAQIPLDILLNGALYNQRDEVLRRVTESGEWVEEAFSIIDPKAGTITRQGFRAIVNRKMAELRAKGKELDCIMLDYLQLFVTGDDQQEKEITDWTRMLKLMALELDTPIFLISNLNNAYDRRLEQIKADQPYVRGSRADFRGSGNICFDASKVLFLLQHHEAGQPIQTKLWLQVVKNKFGPKDKVVRLRIANDLSFHDGHNIEKKREEAKSEDVGHPGVPAGEVPSECGENVECGASVS
jgi:replicative DNA helicase